MLRVFGVIGLLAALDRDAELVCRLDGRVDQVANDPVTVGRDADFLATANQLANHAYAGESLSGARRALHWQNATRQMRTEPHRGFDSRFPGAMQRFAADPRAFAEKKIARRLTRPVAAHAMIRNIVADPHQRLGHDLTANIAMGEHGFRLTPAVSWRFLMSMVSSLKEIASTFPSFSFHRYLPLWAGREFNLQ